MICSFLRISFHIELPNMCYNLIPLHFDQVLLHMLMHVLQLMQLGYPFLLQHYHILNHPLNYLHLQLNDLISCLCSYLCLDLLYLHYCLNFLIDHHQQHLYSLCLLLFDSCFEMERLLNLYIYNVLHLNLYFRYLM